MTDELPLLGLFQKDQFVGGGAFEGLAFLFHLAQDAADAGMRVLAVVDRVLGALLDGEVHVEFHLGTGFSRVEEEAGRVDGDVVEEVDEGDGVAGPLRDLDRFAVGGQLDELHEDHVQFIATDAEGFQGTLHAGDMAVVVGAPDVDGLFEAADDQLVAVVRDVRREVGRVAVGADEDVILELELVDVLLALPRLLQDVRLDFDVLVPEGAVLFVGQALLRQFVDGLHDLAALVERALIEPGVVFDTVLVHGGLHAGDVLRQGVVDEGLAAFLFGGVLILLARFGDERFRQFDDVLPVV